MKKSIIIYTAAILTSVAGLISCESSAKKVENAKENVTEANIDLEKANREYLEEVEMFRRENEEKFIQNVRSIEEFKARIKLQKKSARAEYNKKIADLEQKNSDMKRKMDDYQDSGKEQWAKFKDEFSHDMEEIGKAFSDVTVNNVK